MKCYQIKKIKELGKQISKDQAQRKIDYQCKTTHFNVHIIVIVTEGYYSIASDITFSDTFESFQSLYAEGEYIDSAYYEIETVKLAGCPKGGWHFGQI